MVLEIPFHGTRCLSVWFFSGSEKAQTCCVVRSTIDHDGGTRRILPRDPPVAALRDNCNKILTISFTKTEFVELAEDYDDFENLKPLYQDSKVSIKLQGIILFKNGKMCVP